jgi:hypothetical protein
MGPPEGWLGGFVPLRLVLSRAPDTLVTLGWIAAYPTGVELELQVVTRQQRPELRSFMGDEDNLRLGVAFADGRKWQGGHPRQWKDTPPGPVLMYRGGSGSDHQYTQGLWLWPLPPPGPVTFALSWPQAGIAESTVQIDGGVLQAAATEAQKLWEPLSPEEEEAAMRSLRQGLLARAGGSYTTGVMYGVSAQDDDEKK